MVGFLYKTLVVRISQHYLLSWACAAKKYISSMSKNKSERNRWMDASSPELKDKIKLMLLMLDIKDVLPVLELLSLERGMKNSTVMSWRYLKR
jgi:hypothetical protein